jgi:hypothetical protein
MYTERRCPTKKSEPAAEEPAAEEPAAEEPAAEETGGKVEIFSWWTAGGEAEGLAAMFDIYSAQYPEVEIVNATVTLPSLVALAQTQKPFWLPVFKAAILQILSRCMPVLRLKNTSLRPSCSRSKICTISLCSQRIS